MSEELRRRRVTGREPEIVGEGREEGGTRKDGKRRKSRRRVLWAGALLLLVAAVVWALPQPIDPVSFRLCNGSMRALEGPLAVNTHLKQAQHLFPGDLCGPEAFVRDAQGFIYTGLGDGRVVRLDSDLQHYITVTRVGKPPYDQCGTVEAEGHCGRVLGLHPHHSNPDILYATDSTFGLLQLNISSGDIEVLVPQGQRDGKNPFINFGNDLVVLSNGSIFFTDSSRKFSRHDSVLDVYEGRPNGQLLHYHPEEKRCHVAVAEMHFPNGICLSQDGEALLISETTRARIQRYHLTGPLAGSVDTFIDNLPGLPDNISPSFHGNYWVAFAATRKLPIIDNMTQMPLLRALFVKLHLARTFTHIVPKHGLIIEVDPNGQIIRSLHDDGGEVVQSISHVLDLGDRLLLGSYEAPYAAVVHI